MNGEFGWKVQLFKLNYDNREYDAVNDVLKGGWITMGQKTIDFENAYSTELGQGVRCLAVANGTAALHIAVLACGIERGDEVIVPSLTFIADLNAVTMSGGKVVIGDVTSMQDWSIDPNDIVSKINSRTKAIMVVHYAGYSCDMDSIVRICKKYHLKLIEDCAHSCGGSYKGRKLGTFGDISAWSFFSNKNIAVGEGGMIAINNQDLYQKCKNLRSHGMTVASFDKIKGRAATYDVLEAGFNYRTDEIHAAIGLVQLDKLNESNAARKKLVDWYFDKLCDLSDFLSLPFSDFDRGTPTYHIMPVLLNEEVDRNKVIEYMNKCRVQTSIHYPAIQSFSAYKNIVGPTPRSQYVSEHELTLPIYPTMSEEEVNIVTEALKKSFLE